MAFSLGANIYLSLLIIERRFDVILFASTDVYHSSQNDLIIDTKVRGNPRPKITWVKDNLPVVLDDRRVQIEHLDGVCELIINKPTPSDSGVYTCLAENKLGSQKTTHTVVVDVVQSSRRSSLLSGVMTESDSEAAATGEAGGKKAEKGNRLPKGKKKDDDAEAGTYERRSRMPDPSPKTQLYFIANLSNRYVAEGTKVKLQAVVGGPDATFKWQKDEQNVTYGPRIRNMSREGMACLEFLNTAPEDSGLYTLAAQNEFCKITTSALLHVYSPKVSTDVQPMFTRSVKGKYVQQYVVAIHALCSILLDVCLDICLGCQVFRNLCNQNSCIIIIRFYNLTRNLSSEHQ